MRFLIAASAALGLLAGGASAQTPYSQQSGGPATDTPVLDGAQASPDCGNLHGMGGRAFCVTAPLVNVGALAEAYIAAMQSQGWLVASGDENRVVFVKRRAEGGCDGLQMVAFYDTSRPASPEAAGYLGFATIPGNVCTETPTP